LGGIFDVRHLCPYLLPVALVSLGFCCCLAATPVVCGQVVPDRLPWVRTADGWELLGSWLHTIPVGPKLNPLLVAAGQILGCLYGLLAFSSEPGVPTSARSTDVGRHPNVSQP
jgi:hypothetical protein